VFLIPQPTERKRMPEFHTLSAGGMTAVCHLALHGANSNCLYLVSYSANLTALRAITAHLRDKDSRAHWKTGVKLYSEPAYLEEGADYLYQELRLDGSIFNAVFMHPGFSPANTQDDAFLFHAGGDQPPDFINRVKETMTLPFLPAWAGKLWLMAANPAKVGMRPDNAPIQRLEGHGPLTGYRILRNEHTWLWAIRQAFGVKVQDERKETPRGAR
jgi:hypothetical protein